MGDFISAVILIFAVACIALLVYSKMKEIKGKGCAGCKDCKEKKGSEKCEDCRYRDTDSPDNGDG